ncbi:MAG: hypothetical protein LUF33_08260 [Clostridiales bacterium]|nr:hypothetical protein [Clostridiales bacterium]
MKMKKICSVVLIAVMLLSAFSITASASGYIDLNSSVYEVTQLPDNLEEPDEDTAAQLKSGLYSS